MDVKPRSREISWEFQMWKTFQVFPNPTLCFLYQQTDCLGLQRTTHNKKKYYYQQKRPAKKRLN